MAGAPGAIRRLLLHGSTHSRLVGPHIQMRCLYAGVKSSPTQFEQTRASRSYGMQLRQMYSMEHVRTDLQKVVQYTQHIGEGPIPVLVIGGAGLLPFVSVPLICLGGSFDPCWAFNQLAYGASILSFLGGARWASELGLGSGSTSSEADYASLGLAVAPAIAAWLSLMMPLTLGYLTVSSGLIGLAYMDIFRSSYPRWYKGLRGGLTAVAVGSLLLTLVFKAILKEREPKKKGSKPAH